MNEIPDNRTDELNSVAGATGELQRLRSQPAPPPDKPDFRAIEIENFLRGLFDNMTAGAEETAAFIENQILPYSTSDEAALPGFRASHFSELRRIVRDWIERLPEEKLYFVRKRILKQCLDWLRTETRRQLIYQLDTIGFRDVQVLETLKTLASREDDLGDLAIRTISDLEPVGEHREWLHRLIRARMNLHPTDELTTAAASQTMLDLLDCIAAFLETSTELFPGISRLAWMCRELPGSVADQEKIWATGRRVSNARPDGLPALAFSGLISNCLCPVAIEDVVNDLPRFERSGQVYRWLSQMENLTSPVHTGSLHGARGNPALDILRANAIADTKIVGRSQSIESTMKLASFETILAIGDMRVFEWADAAIEQENNPYGLARLINNLSVLPFAALPNRVAQTLEQPHEIQSGGGSPETTIKLAASRLTATSNTVSALQILLNCNLTAEGYPFTQPIEEGGRLGAWLIDKHREVLDILVENTRHPRTKTGGSVALRALRQAAAMGRLPRGSAGVFLEIMEDERRDWYVRQDAMVGAIEAGGDLGADRVADLLSKFFGPGDERLKVVAIKGLLSLRKHGSFLQEIHEFVFGTADSKVWGQAAIRDLDANRAQILGALGATDPDKYATPLASFIKLAHSIEVNFALRQYSWTIDESSRATSDVVLAIIERIKSGENRESAQLFLFDFLAKLSPDSLFAPKWPDFWSEWMPDAREALANAIPTAIAGAGPQCHQTALDWLKTMMGDPLFAVRRAAARAFATIDARALQELCRVWLDTASIQRKLRVAEAAAWLPIENDLTMENEFLKKLRRDEERTVRSRAETSRDELIRRKWASIHLQTISKARSDPLEWVIDSYGAGRALKEVGDDFDLLAIEKLSGDPTIPPNIAIWLGKIEEGIRSQWKQTTSKWPESWMPCRGAVEEFDGELAIADTRYPVRFSLWREALDGDSPTVHWGGGAGSKATPPLVMFFQSTNASSVILSAPNRRDAEVQVTGTSSGSISFFGIGNYPVRVAQ